MTPSLSRIRHALTLAFALATGGAVAQTALPPSPIRIIVATTPGTTPDVMSRAIAPKLAERLDRTVLVENRAGAGSVIGNDSVVRSAPSGATLLMSASTLTIGASLNPSTPYDPERDLTPIAFVGWNRLVLVTPPKTGFKTVGDLVAAARKSPGELNYASPGIGTPNHLMAELLKARTGTSLTHIPYKGSGPQITGVLAGEVALAPLTVIAALPHIKAGKLIPLAVSGDKESPLLPGVPSLAKAGVPDVHGDIWYGLFGPKGMAPALTSELNGVVNDILRMPEIQSSFAAQGFDIEPTTTDVFRKLVSDDVKRWSTLIKEQGIKAD